MSVAEKRCAMSRVKELKGGEKKLTALGNSWNIRVIENTVISKKQP